MLKIGLTGNIGSGKSIVARIFGIIGTPVYKADEESKKFLDFQTIQSQIKSAFGPEIISPEGKIDRKKLGTIVFKDPASLNTLNSILHPLVITDFLKWADGKTDHHYILLEAAIIFEGGYQKLFDKIIHVSCPPDFAIERVIRRDRITREEVERRMQFQFDDQKKAAMSDFIIRNDGSEMVIPQVLSIHQELLKICS